jgi:hypothetical protein
MMKIDDLLVGIMRPTDSTPKFSLLVFQAVLFAGSAHCDIKPLRMMGFLTRKAARKALFERTKVGIRSAESEYPLLARPKFQLLATLLMSCRRSIISAMNRTELV